MPIPDRIRQLAAAAAYGCLHASGAPAVWRRLHRPAPILCYHNVVGDGDPAAGEPGLHMPRSRFERQMRWLAAHFDVVPARELALASDAGSTRRPRAAITFDDGYAGVVEHALPVLRRLGLPATIFALVGYQPRGFWWDQPRVLASMTPERRARWMAELRGDAAAILSDVAAPGLEPLPSALRPAGPLVLAAHAGDGIEIGVHSATHRALPSLTDAELEEEIVATRAALERTTGLRAGLFAYPYGWSDDRVAAVVARAGYDAAFGLTPSRAVAVDPWRIGRINVPAGISLPALEAWTLRAA